MSAIAERLLQELQQLSPEERDDIVRRLYEDESDIDLGPEWAEEIKRRIEDYASGKVKGIPLAEARRMIFEEDADDATP